MCWRMCRMNDPATPHLSMTFQYTYKPTDWRMMHVLPCVCTYPLVDDGHPAIFEQLQVLWWCLKTHHFWQQSRQFLQFCNIWQFEKTFQNATIPKDYINCLKQNAPNFQCKSILGSEPLPSPSESVATNTLSSLCFFIKLRIFLMAPLRLGTSSLWPQIKSFLRRWTPR